MLNRNQGLELLNQNIQEDNLIKHCLATEAVMRRLAHEFGANQEIWSLTGLLHDLDYSLTQEEPSRHGIQSASMLQDKLPPEAVQAIKRHAAELNQAESPSTTLDYALRCSETVTGLIMAAALVRPDRLAGMTAKSLKKKMKDKAFAAAVNRDLIKEHEKLGLDQNQFLSIAIEAMQEVASDIGLDHSSRLSWDE